MKKIPFFILILIFSSHCGFKEEKIEKIIEDEVEVVINHLEPYRIRRGLSSLILEEKFTIDPEKRKLAEVGIGDILAFDIDSMGNIYTFNPRSKSSLIFKFDKEGNYLNSFGRRGSGPGELQSPSLLKINSQDDIVIADSRGRRIVILDQNGSLIKQIVINFNAGLVVPLQNENYLCTSQQFNPEAEFNYSIISLYSSGFKKIKELDRIKQYNVQRAKRIDPIGQRWITGVINDRIFLGNTERDYKIWVYDLEGNLVRKIRKDYRQVPVSEETKERNLKRFEKSPAQIRNKVYFPKSMPAFQYGFPDDEGRLFVMTYEKGDDPREYMYDIFNPDGIFIGRVALDNSGGMGETHLFAMSKKRLLYYIREKESGFKELVVFEMRWQ